MWEKTCNAHKVGSYDSLEITFVLKVRKRLENDLLYISQAIEQMINSQFLYNYPNLSLSVIPNKFLNIDGLEHCGFNKKDSQNL